MGVGCAVRSVVGPAAGSAAAEPAGLIVPPGVGDPGDTSHMATHAGLDSADVWRAGLPELNAGASVVDNCVVSTSDEASGVGWDSGPCKWAVWQSDRQTESVPPCAAASASASLLELCGLIAWCAGLRAWSWWVVKRNGLSDAGAGVRVSTSGGCTTIGEPCDQLLPSGDRMKWAPNATTSAPVTPSLGRMRRGFEFGDRMYTSERALLVGVTTAPAGSGDAGVACLKLPLPMAGVAKPQAGVAYMQPSYKVEPWTLPPAHLLPTLLTPVPIGVSYGVLPDGDSWFAAEAGEDVSGSAPDATAAGAAKNCEVLPRGRLVQRVGVD